MADLTNEEKELAKFKKKQAELEEKFGKEQLEQVMGIFKPMFRGREMAPLPDKTDLDAIKDVMRSLLEAEIEIEPLARPLTIYHPFWEDYTVLCQDSEEIAFKAVDVLDDPDGLEEAKKWMRKRIDKADSIDALIALIRNNYLITFVEKIKNLMSCEDLSKTFKKIWMIIECGSLYRYFEDNVEAEDLMGIFEACNPEILMGEDDYKFFQELPDEFTVYRATRELGEPGYFFMPWTLDLDVAISYANKLYNMGWPGIVYKARIKKQCVFAYFSDRNESTVMLNPYGLRDDEEVTVIEH